jgi:hypothetical protein
MSREGMPSGFEPRVRSRFRDNGRMNPFKRDARMPRKPAPVFGKIMRGNQTAKASLARPEGRAALWFGLFF